MRPKCSLLLPLSRVTRTKRRRFQSRLYAKTSNTACSSMKIINIIFADADADADADLCAQIYFANSPIVTM